MPTTEELLQKALREFRDARASLKPGSEDVAATLDRGIRKLEEIDNLNSTNKRWGK